MFVCWWLIVIKKKLILCEMNTILLGKYFYEILIKDQCR